MFFTVFVKLGCLTRKHLVFFGGGGEGRGGSFRCLSNKNQSTSLSFTKDQIIKHNYSFCQLDLKRFIKSNYFLLHNFYLF